MNIVDGFILRDGWRGYRINCSSCRYRGHKCSFSGFIYKSLSNHTHTHIYLLCRYGALVLNVVKMCFWWNTLEPCVDCKMSKRYICETDRCPVSWAIANTIKQFRTLTRQEMQTEWTMSMQKHAKPRCAFLKLAFRYRTAQPGSTSDSNFCCQDSFLR